jgi:hypothetical protein
MPKAPKTNTKEVIVAVGSDGRYSINKEILMRGIAHQRIESGISGKHETVIIMPTPQPPTSRSSM